MTMNGFPLSQSPRTQGFAQPSSPEDEEELFSKGFSDLAYRAFQKTHPELYGDLVSFRVLATDAQSGEGVGAFILKRAAEVLFVPAVIADNAVKPLDMVYVRSKDRFYPLTPEWIEKATSGGVSALGRGIEPPKDLNTDVDIRNVVVPPTTGRYSYASEFDAASISDDELWNVYRAANDNEKRAADDMPLVFPEVVRRMPNTIKTAYATWLAKRPRYLRKMAEIYSAGVLRDAFTLIEAPHAKTAADFRKEVPLKHDVYLAVAGMPLQEIRKELAPGDMPEAYKALRTHGFYVKDRRTAPLNGITVEDEEALALTAPEAPGIYRIYLSDGTNTKALIIPQPVQVARPRTDHQEMVSGDYSRREVNDVPSPYSTGKRYLVLLPDGRGGCVSELVAEPVTNESFDSVTSMLKSMTRETPQGKQRGVLISADNLTLRATEPFFAEKPTSRGDMVSFVAGYDMTAVISKKMTGSKIVRPVNQPIMVFPQSYRWFPIKEDLSDRDVLARPELIGRSIEAKIEKTGAARIKVARDHDGFRVGERREKLSALEAVVKVANVYGVSVPDASRVVEAVANGLTVRAWITPKTAAAAAEGQDPNGMTPMDPNAMAAMQAPPPPPPTGIDLAISEKLQMIQAQRAALEQMEQMLGELQGRAQGIDQGGGAMAAPQGAAGMMAGPAQDVMGQPAMAPVPGMSPQAPPAGGGMPQGSDPNAMAPQGGDPNAMAPQGGDPNAMAMQGEPPPPPPQPVMPKEPNPALFAEQVAPQFLDQAMELDQAGVFDASAVASLANVRSIRDLLQNYTPSLDNALDRLGRTLLLLYVKSKQIRERIGEEAFTSLEQVVRDVFRMLGDAVLSLEQYGDQLLPAGARSA